MGIDRWRPVDGHIDSLWRIGRTDQIAALGFHLRPLGGFECALRDLAQAGIRVTVAARGRGRSGLFLVLRLPLGSNVCTLGVFTLLDKTAHAFDVALGLLAIGLGDGFIGSYGQCAAATRAG